MRPVQHKTNNDVLGAPAGVPHEECKSLPITRVRYDNGMPAVWSFWQPNPAERAAIAGGAPVMLSLWGLTMPPASLGVYGVEGDS